LMPLIRDMDIHGLCHVTGGGFEDNIPRILPTACKAVLKRNSWEKPSVFEFLQKAGSVEETEMLRTFNCGIGMVMIVPPKIAGDVVDRLQATGEKVWTLGSIEDRNANEPQVQWID